MKALAESPGTGPDDCKLPSLVSPNLNSEMYTTSNFTEGALDNA